MFGIPEIAIIGAGPSGLTLGALLAKRGVPFTIYENRARPTEADLDAVSGMLDMHDESGLAAIRACGLYDDFLPLTAGGGDGDRILDLNGDVRYCGPTGEWRPEIARNDLTRLVLSRVPEGMIRWGRKLRSAREAGDGTVVLNFEDEDPVVVDLVVGADGAWSKVRRELIPDAGTPRYTGVQDLAVAATQFGTRYPALDDMIGKGNMFALGLGNQCGGHRGSHDSCLLHMSVQAEEEDFVRVRGLEGKTAAEVATAFLEDEKLFGQWGERMKELMRTVCDEDTKAHPGRVAEIRGVYELPIGHKWQHRPGVTIIGDAAHLMTPWAGEGANIAMWDALDLAQVIGDVWDTITTRGEDSSDVRRRAWRKQLDPNLAAFEEVMQDRGARSAEDSSNNSVMLFADDAVEKLVAFFKSFGPPTE